MKFLFGNSKISHVILIILFGATIGAFIYFLLDAFTWQNVMFSILCVDISAGIITNAREQTNIVWKNTKKSTRIIFIVAHLTLYPAILILLIGLNIVLYFALGLLLIKTLFFVFGVINNKRLYFSDSLC